MTTTARPREAAIYTAREFAARATPSTLWIKNDILTSIVDAGRLVATILRDLFQFIADADFTPEERTLLLYDDSKQAVSMRSGAFRVLQWIQDRINESAPDLAGVVFRWVGFFAEALDANEQDLDGRELAADLAFDLLLKALPPAVNDDLGAYALQFADLAARIDTAFGAGTGTGRSRAEVLRLLQAHYALRRGRAPPPASSAFEAQREMHSLVQAYYDEADILRGQLSTGRQLKNLRDWWEQVAVPSARRFITTGADPVAILLPSAHFSAQRQTFGDVWVQAMGRENLAIARCTKYEEHVELLAVANTLMLINLDFALSQPPYTYWIGLRMQQKIMRALTVIVRQGSPLFEVMRLKGTLSDVLLRYARNGRFVDVQELLEEDELALLGGFAAAFTSTRGNPSEDWNPDPLGSVQQVKWTNADRVWVLQQLNASLDA